MTTRGSTESASRAYYAYGAERSASGTPQTDRTFTGQKSDASGLMYYNARYYDPALGTFISPDSMVPNPASVIDHNRFLYARGNPLKYSDPSGHNPLGPEWEEAFRAAHNGRRPNADDRRDRLASVTIRGPATGKQIWEGSDWQSFQKNKFSILMALVAVAGFGANRTWDFTDRGQQEDFMLLTGGVLELANKIGSTIGGGVEEGLFRLRNRLGGFVTFSRQLKATSTSIICASNSNVKDGTPACAAGSLIEFYGPIFGSRNKTWVGGTVVHELAHIVNNQSCDGVGQCKTPALFLPGWDEKNNEPIRELTGYAMKFDDPAARRSEYWAGALAVWVYGPDYKGGRLTLVQDRAIELIMQR